MSEPKPRPADGDARTPARRISGRTVLVCLLVPACTLGGWGAWTLWRYSTEESRWMALVHDGGLIGKRGEEIERIFRTRSLRDVEDGVALIRTAPINSWTDLVVEVEFSGGRCVKAELRPPGRTVRAGRE